MSKVRQSIIQRVAKDIGFCDVHTAELFNYLDAVRESGVTNMFGAVPYLIAHNDKLSREKAIIVLRGWMELHGK